MSAYILDQVLVNGVPLLLNDDGTATITIQSDLDIMANYLGEAPPGVVFLVIQVEGLGTTSPSGTQNYYANTTIVITATPSGGTPFSHWELDGVNVGSANPYTLNMGSSNHIIKAVFATTIPSHILVVTTTPIISVPIVLDGQNYITPTPPITLPEGSHSVSCPSNIIIGSDTYNLSQWEDGSTNPQRTFPLAADTTIIASYVLVQPPPAKGSIEVHAFFESIEIVTSGVIVETGQTFQTPTTIIVDPGTYVVRVTKDTEVKEQWAVVTTDQTIRLDFQFQPPAPISPLRKVLPVLAPILIGGVSLSIQRRG